MTSSTSPSYQVADRDELEAFGREHDPSLDTSAGLEPDEDVRLAEAASSSSKRRVCVCVMMGVLTLIGTAIFLAVFFSQRATKSSSSTPTQQGQPPDKKASPTPLAAGSIPTTTSPPSKEKVPTYNVSVISSSPHDEQAFVEGFEFGNGHFYESTGLNRRSSLRKVEPDSGQVVQRFDFTDPNMFGEGFTLHKDEHIFMVTWKMGKGFVFNQSTLQVIKEWTYQGEGWGLTMDRTKDEVWMSNGTTILSVFDPETLSVKRTVNVTLNGKPVTYLNELEWICGEVWANVWQSRNIYRIDPESGVVKAIIDAHVLPLSEDTSPTMDVLNGIAFDGTTGRLWMTGKLWKKVYLVNISDTSLDLKSCKKRN